MPWALAALAVGIMAVPRPAAAQAGCDPQPGRIRLRMSPAAVVFPTPGAIDFDLGWIESAPVEVRVNALGQKGWTLCLRSEDADLGGGKPVGELEWRLEGDPGWQPIDLVDRLVTRGSGSTRVLVRFRVLLDWAVDGAGTHGAVLAFSGHRG